MKDFDDDDFFDSDDEGEIVTLRDQKTGKDVDFDVLAVLDYKDKWYTVLAPCTPIKEIDEDECLIFEIVEKADGSEDYIPVSEEIMDAVFAEFEKMREE
jgi:methyl coenzyme M reductase gamma subunit